LRQPERVYEPPRDARESTLQQIWQTVLGIEPISRRDRFFELGGDSLGALRLINALNTRFHIDLPMRSLFDNPTIESLAGVIGSATSGSATSGSATSGSARTGSQARHLVALQPNGTKPRLFCIHPAGGHVFCYLPLVGSLGADRPVFGLEASGLESGDPLPASIEEMASAYLDAIREIQPEGPYHLLGMSSGGLIAFEMARQLRDGGAEVGLLALLDTTVPNPEDSTPFTEQMLVEAMAGEFGCPDLIPAPPAVLTLAELVEKARTGGRLPPGFTLAHAGRIANVFRNTVRCHWAYRPRPWEGPMLLVRALRRAREGDLPPDWAPYVKGALDSIDLDCGHMDVISGSFSPIVAAFLMHGLERPKTIRNSQASPPNSLD
jgi:thioesterase domain-containing protein/acyl carrier protein